MVLMRVVVAAGVVVWRQRVCGVWLGRALWLGCFLFIFFVVVFLGACFFVAVVGGVVLLSALAYGGRAVVVVFRLGGYEWWCCHAWLVWVVAALPVVWSAVRAGF